MNVNCAFGGEACGSQDTRDYDDRESDNPDYRVDLSHGPVLLAIRGDNGSSSVLGIEEIDGRRTDTDVEAYLANHIISGEYLGAEREIERDVFKTFDKTNLISRGHGKKERTIQSVEKSLKRSRKYVQKLPIKTKPNERA